MDKDKKVYRVLTDTLYDSPLDLAKAIEKEKAYAKHLEKDFGELTNAERRKALHFALLVKDEKPPAKKKGKD